MNEDVKCHCLPTDALAALLLRLDLGILFFFAGLTKFLGKGGVFGAIDMLIGGFKETFMPSFMVTPFAYIIPFAEVALGVLLILGLMTRAALLAAGFLMLGLLLGVMVLGNSAAISSNFMYEAVIVAALWFVSRDNRYSLDRLFHIH
jgi:thiosulfate dehydrogenase [quinone] large subunit